MPFGGIYTNLIHIENGWISSNAVPTVLETSKTTAYVSLHSADNPIINDQKNALSPNFGVDPRFDVGNT